MNHDLGLLIFQIGSVWNILGSYKWIAFSICDDGVSAPFKLSHWGAFGTDACLSVHTGWALPLPLLEAASFWIRQFTSKGLSDTLANCFSLFFFNHVSFLAQFTCGRITHSSALWEDQVCTKVPWNEDAFCYQSCRYFLIHINLVSLVLLTFFFRFIVTRAIDKSPVNSQRALAKLASTSHAFLWLWSFWISHFTPCWGVFSAWTTLLSINESLCFILTTQWCGLNDPFFPLSHPPVCKLLLPILLCPKISTLTYFS